jgi:hypothetical protein
MGSAIKIAGIFIALIGIVCLVSPATIKAWFKVLGTGNRSGLIVVISLILGVFLVVASRESAITWIPFYIGLLALAKGLILLAYGPKRFIMKASAWFATRSGFIQLSSVMSIALGVLLYVSV